MARKVLIRTAEFPYHIRARTNNREWWPIPIDQVWKIMGEVHDETVIRYNFESHAFILMSNHYHWLVSTPEENLDDGMRYFNTETSKKIGKAASRINKIYGGRYGWSLVQVPHLYQRAFRYVYMNPIRASICDNPAQYPWSTLVDASWKITDAVGFSEGMPKGIEALSEWMLSLREEDDEARVRMALRRRVFELPRKKNGFK